MNGVGNQHLMNISGVSCYEENGTAYLRLEDVARGLGFTRIAASGNEVIRWERVDKYLKDFGVPTCGHDGYIPENIFYRLAMKARNETAEKFQALVADEIIPSIRRTGGYFAGQEKLSPEELMQKMLEYTQKTIEMLKQENTVLRAKAEYFDDLAEQRTLTSVRETAKELEIGQKVFTEFLIDNGYAYRKANGQLRPRAGKSNGLLELREVRSPRSTWNGVQVFITPKGRETFRILCKKLVKKSSDEQSKAKETSFPGEEGSVLNITAVASALKINRLKFFKELENIGMIYKTENGYVPMQEYLENGYLIQSEYHDPDTGKVTYSAKVTKSGFEFLVNRFGAVDK